MQPRNKLIFSHTFHSTAYYDSTAWHTVVWATSTVVKLKKKRLIKANYWLLQFMLRKIWVKNDYFSQ